MTRRCPKHVWKPTMSMWMPLHTAAMIAATSTIPLSQ